MSDLPTELAAQPDPMSEQSPVEPELTNYSGDVIGLSKAADELAANRAREVAEAEEGEQEPGAVIPSSDDTEGLPVVEADAADAARSADAPATLNSDARLKDALRHPYVRQAISEQFDKVEAARQNFAQRS